MKLRKLYLKMLTPVLAASVVVPGAVCAADTWAEETVVESTDTDPASENPGADQSNTEAESVPVTDAEAARVQNESQTESQTKTEDEVLKEESTSEGVPANLPADVPEQDTGIPADDEVTTSGVGAKKELDENKPEAEEKAEKEEEFTGWKNEKGFWLYYKDGVPYKGWNYMDSEEGEKEAHWSYFGSDGRLYTGWHNMGKKEGEKKAHWSYFGDNGWLRTGWVQLGKADGEKVTHWSYFGDNGWLRTGWVQLGKADGEKVTHWSYFGDNGWLRTGWVQLGEGTSEPDGNSARHWSYFGDNGWLQTEWKYFTEKDGEKSPHWSYFGANGWLRTGWYTNNEGLHWFDGNGWLAVGNPVIEGKLYNDTNNNGVLRENTVFTGWHYYKGRWHHIYKGSVNPQMKAATYYINGQWYEIENGISTGISKGKAILAQASKDENGRFVNGAAGDQTIAEVFTRSWFTGPTDDYGKITPWEYVIRAKDETVRKKIAYAMERAVNNDKIGYDMNNRKTLYNYASRVGWDPGKVTLLCECDCSSLVAVACRYAGISANYIEVGSNVFVTSNMRNKLLASGQFTAFSSKDYTAAHDKLVVGDILVKENGHTAVVIRSDADMK